MKQSRLIVLFTLLLITGCRSAPALPVPTDTPTKFNCSQPGKVESLSLNSFGEIGVYLPPCYDSSTTNLYPVYHWLEEGWN
jgi:hypothetical protein